MAKSYEGKEFYLTNRHTATTTLLTEIGMKQTDCQYQADLLVFPGGSDITPFLYGETLHPTTSPDPRRDMQEVTVFNRSWKEQHKLGICRGAQLLNCLMPGGSMWQDVDGHRGNHAMQDKRTGEVVVTNSLHHQMAILCEGAKLIAGADETTTRSDDSATYKVKAKANKPLDPEVWYIDDINSLCVQGHPEYKGTELTGYFMDLLDVHMSSSKSNRFGV